jgi:hypothetical protein
MHNSPLYYVYFPLAYMFRPLRAIIRASQITKVID